MTGVADRRLRVARPLGRVDLEAAERATRALLEAVGADPAAETPRRVALPGERIIGLSKLARVVELFARDLQTQERLTAQVAGWLDEHLGPRGAGVVIDAEHLCMTVRGVKAPGVRTVTSALRGQIRDDPGPEANSSAWPWHRRIWGAVGGASSPHMDREHEIVRPVVREKGRLCQ